MTLHTIGYGGVAFSALAESLTEARCDIVVDVRATPYSKSAPIYSAPSLHTELAKAGLAYEHAPELGNGLLVECKQVGHLGPYVAHLANHPAALGPLRELLHASRRPALLCGCPRPDLCHRSVIAQAIAQEMPVRVQHLRPKLGEGRGPAPRILGLTLIQPWAWAIAHAGKRLENRTWRPWCPIGTYLAIHAGQRVDREAVADLQGVGVKVPLTLPTSAIVAVARLVGTCDDTGVPGDQLMWWAGPVGWVLDRVVAVEPLPCAGRQGLWELPAALLAPLRERWRAARG